MLGNTPVYLPIERLQVGDVVVSRNEYSGATEYKTIVGVTKKTAQTLVTLHLADAATGKEVQVVQATPEHPFRVFARGWVRAGQLGIGTSIVTRAGPALVVIAIEHQERAEGYSVYNLTVDQDHTYFVGAAQGGTWVHNSGDCDAPGSLFGEEDFVSQSPTKRWQLRDNMIEAGNHPSFEGAQAHHELPWEFREEFASRGLNVNDAEFGKWVGDNHQIWSSEYQMKWRKWLDAHPSSTGTHIRALLSKIRASTKWGKNYK